MSKNRGKANVMNINEVDGTLESTTADLVVGKIELAPNTLPEGYVIEALPHAAEGFKLVGTNHAPTIRVNVYKTCPEAQLPEYATAGSSCFDLRACITKDTVVKGYGAKNNQVGKTASRFVGSDSLMVQVDPGERLLVPLGLIFDLPEGTTLKLYPRSGLSLKTGLHLANCVGIVDDDYVDPTFAIITNDSVVPAYISHGERICQGEIVINPPRTSFNIVDVAPKQKTTRKGGFGHTGSH